MTTASCFGTELGVMVLAGLLTSGKGPTRTVGLLLGLFPLGLPFVMRGAEPLAAFAIAWVAMLSALRVSDLFRDPRSWSWGRRLWHVFGVFDTREVRPTPRRLEVGVLLQAALWSAAAVLAVALGVCCSRALHDAPRALGRWAAGAAFALAAFEAGPRLVVAAYHALGVDPPPLHDRPYLSRSVTEFWGVRWNKVIGQWLRQTVYLPLARRGRPWAGVVASFAASALLHAYLLLPAVGGRWALLAGSFFLAQAAVVVAERWLGVRRWSPLAGRSWTVGTLLLLAPLCLEPMLRAIDPAG